MTRWKTALVTGGGTGIGESIARQLIAEGTKVAICGRRMEPLEKLKGELGPNLEIIQADVADPDRAKAVVDEAHEILGSLDLVIANAGMGRNKHGTKLEVRHIVDILNVNMLGACATVTAAIPYMLAKKSGTLVGITSIAGVRGLPTNAAYAASKAGASTFLESLRVDLKRSGIAVVDIRPGFIDTPLTKKNKFRMPFLLTSDEAARRILRAIAKRKPVYTFPWPMALVIRLVGALPNWLYDLFASRAKI